MIRVENLNKSFDGQKILKDLNLAIPEGELWVVLGESGSGKSVFLQHLVGILKPDSGRVLIDGESITGLSEKRLLAIRKQIGYLFQQGALYDFMTVFENVAFPLQEHTSLKPKEISKKVMAMLAMLGIQESFGKYPSELSGGMKKRCALARSIILGTRILLCDEPTSGLDPIRSRNISDLIRNVTNRMKCTTLVASHDIANSLRIADHLVLIHGGAIIARGSPDELAANDNGFVKEFLLSAQ